MRAGLPLATSPTRRQSAGLLALVLVVAVLVPLLSTFVDPSTARSFDLVSGSIYLDDDRAPVAVDLAAATATARLVDADAQVGARSSQDVHVVALDSGSLLLDATTGEFNLIDAGGFVVKANGGVRLPGAGAEPATALAAGDSAYIVQAGPTSTDVYLVGRQTVEAARTAGTSLVPRASAAVDAPTRLEPGAQAVAGTDLWLLVGGAGPTRTIRRLALPPGSDAGVGLSAGDHGKIVGAAALGVTSTPAGDVLAVATTTGLQILTSGRQQRAARQGQLERGTGTGARAVSRWVIPVPGLAGADTVLPAANQSGRLSFLYRLAAGWDLVSVAADGTGLVGPMRLDRVPADAVLAAPMAAAGRLWTMETGVAGAGRLWQISDGAGAIRIPGAAAYPVVLNPAGRAVEAGGFGDGAVVVRGSRVLFNSPSHTRALAVFADGSHPPRIVDKSAAVDLSSAGGAAAVIQDVQKQAQATSHRQDRERAPQEAQATPSPTPPPVSAPQTVDNTAKCDEGGQLAHVPTIVSAVPGSRSVRLQWSYPILDTQDCVPSTYTVSVVPQSTGAPKPPGTVRVQGQTGVEITGLFPSKTYDVTVTAYLGSTGTPSLPSKVTTGPEGPAAPSSVTVTAGKAGGWQVSWRSCGGRSDCIPVDSWALSPSFCDGRGLSSPPADTTVAGDPTQNSFTTAVPAAAALLGRSLSFTVKGSGVDGEAGDPAKGGCVTSWGTPTVSSAALTASAPPPSRSGHTTTSTTVSLAVSDLSALGGVGASVTFELLTGRAPIESKSVVVDQPPSGGRLSVTFVGLAPGVAYQARAKVAPPGHPSAAVTVGPVDVKPAQTNWPHVSATATFKVVDHQTGTLTVKLAGISSAGSRGETFDVEADLGCGNAHLPLRLGAIDPADPLIWTKIDRFTFNGSCTATVSLAQSSGTLYGPQSSVKVAAGVTITPPDVSVSAADFAAAWTDVTGGRSGVGVTFTGDKDVPGHAGNWAVDVSDDNGTTYACGSGSGAPPDVVTVDQSCVDAHGADLAPWQVRVSFDLLGQTRGPFVVSKVTGSPPSYSLRCFVKPTDFSAAWGGAAGSPAVLVSYTPTTSKLAGCSGWQFKLVPPVGTGCGTVKHAPDPQTPVRLAPTCSAAVTDPGWTVTAGWTNEQGTSQSSDPIDVSGSPP